MNRREFFTRLTGAIAATALGASAAPAAAVVPVVAAPVLPIIVVDDICTWMSLSIQVEIDREMIVRMCAIAGKPVSETYKNEDTDVILHRMGYRRAKVMTYDNKPIPRAKKGEKSKIRFA